MSPRGRDWPLTRTARALSSMHSARNRPQMMRAERRMRAEESRHIDLDAKRTSSISRMKRALPTIAQIRADTNAGVPPAPRAVEACLHEIDRLSALLKPRRPRARSAVATRLLAELTPGQAVVFEHLIRGRRSREIAATLGRSYHTINNHTRQIFRLFGVRSRAELLVRCCEIGVLPRLRA